MSPGHTVRLRQLAEKTKAPADERLTQELIAGCRSFVESLQEAKAFWLKVLQDSRKRLRAAGTPEPELSASGCGKQPPTELKCTARTRKALFCQRRGLRLRCSGP